jgi:ribosomal protein L12E/L44/L45/RPP1/RPP2
MPARVSDLPQVLPDNPANAEADNQTLIVAADQLNDVDRTLREANPPAATSAMAPANPPPAAVTASGRESSTWDETSLIGKIFIGFGALLTMASAARMFMA